MRSVGQTHISCTLTTVLASAAFTLTASTLTGPKTDTVVVFPLEQQFTPESVGCGGFET
jgi:hypothetical protein